MKSEVWGLKSEVWRLKSEVWSLKAEVWGLKAEVWGLSSYDNLKIEILTENALEYLASGKGFIMDRIGDARNLKIIFNYNL